MDWFSPLPIIAFFFGLIFGSFFNVCIYRFPRDESIVKPRSFCPGCGKTIPWYENIPLFSYLFLRGKCSTCGATISFRYFFVEFVTGLTFGFSVFHFGLSLKTAEFLILASLMIILFFTDLDERILPDKITLWFIPVGLVFAFFSMERNLAESILVAILGAGGLALIAWIYFKVKKIEGMGMGDIKMLALMGAFLGIKAFLALLIAALLGTIVGIFIIYVLKKGKRYEIPFGCFLSIGTLVAYVYGNEMLAWYVRRFIAHTL